MNREQLLDAIGQADEKMILEVAQLRSASSDDQNSPKLYDVKAVHRKGRKRLVIILAACMALALCSVAYATGLFARIGGILHITTNPDGYKKTQYEVSGDTRIPFSMITGDVMNSTQDMQQYWQMQKDGLYTPLHDYEGVWNPESGMYELPAEDKGYHFIYTDNPAIHEKMFRSTYDALDYIGYTGPIHVPTLDALSTDIGVCAIGIPSTDDPDATEPPTYTITFIDLMERYMLYGDIQAISTVEIRTEAAFASSPSILYQLPVNLSSETRTVGGREFSILTQDFDDLPGTMTAIVFWQEDNIQYTLNLSYPSDKQSLVDAYMLQWMNSFNN